MSCDQNTTSINPSEQQIEQLRITLINKNEQLEKRFRSAFTLRAIGSDKAVEALADAFKDEPSALLKHEVAYCLGQTQNPHAIYFLTKVLEDKTEHPMVRHEAAEGLGAIGGNVNETLRKFVKDPVREIAETCEIALDRAEWVTNNKDIKNAKYECVDPAPAYPENQYTLPELQSIMLDTSKPLFERYRAIFALRNIGSSEAIQALSLGLKDESALFRHEIAYVFGQLQNEQTIEPLTQVLEASDENPMVRHEAAETLGSIATPQVMPILKKYATDTERVVRESCIVALDILEYFNSEQFQYADGLQVQ